MDSHSAPLIDIQWLTRWYPESPKPLFQDLTLTLKSQDFCFVVGKSGVGKTTLIKFLIRQLVPPKKMIFHKQEDIARYTDKEVQAYRKNLGVIFQDFKLIEWKNVFENIVHPLRLDGYEITPEIEQRVDSILETLEMTDKKESSILHLSGGEKQRVAIARALIREPQFLIADEPTGNIDDEAARTIADIMITLNKKWHTILFITHDHTLIEYVNTKHPVSLVTLHA